MEKLKVTILDMQPIDPPIGGGRLRLFGLYSGFKNNIEATYVGTYDWRGPKYREHRLSECLKEINVPLSEAHFAAHDEIAAKLGKGCIDSVFSMQAYLSDDYIQKSRAEAEKADVVIFSHPWVFPFIVDIIDKSKQLVIYDSHNCESLLRVKLLYDGSDLSKQICHEVIRCEYELCHAADLILACSEEDKNNFINLYEVSANKIVIVPNGVFTNKITPCSKEHKQLIKNKLNIQKPAICFIGSAYLPNEEAARLTLEVSKLLPEYHFIIIGGVCSSLSDADISKYANVTLTGFVDEKEKLEYLHASDLAINPMLSGSGTNIKMFDFMAAGLPIITTEIGARGIPDLHNNLFMISEPTPKAFSESILTLLVDNNRYSDLSANALSEVSSKYSWDKISEKLGDKIIAYFRKNILKENNSILMITTYPPEKCGIATYALQQINFLESQCYNVDVYAIKGKGQYSGELNSPEDIHSLIPLCMNYDKVIIQYHPAFFAPSGSYFERIAIHKAFANLFSVCKNIEVVCHEINYPIDRKSTGVARMMDLRENIIKARKWKEAMSIVFHSKKEQNLFVTKLRFDVNKLKCKIISPHYYYRKYVDISQEEARKRLGLDLNEKIFLCIGFIQGHKAFDKVAEAFMGLKDMPNMKLYIVGSLRLHYDETVTYLKLLESYTEKNSNIKLYNMFVSDQLFDTWLIACDVVVIPYKEIWTSGVLGRAKLFNKKCIVRAVGSLNEQILPSDCMFDDYEELPALIRMLPKSDLLTVCK